MPTPFKLVSAIAVTAIGIAGCAAQPTAGPSGPWIPCDASSPGARCDVRVVQNNASGKYQCELGRFDVIPDAMQFRGGKPVHVHFAVPAGYQFCSADGAVLKSSSVARSYGQVYESFAADKNDGSRSSFDATKNCRPFWIWHWANAGAGTEHEYLIRFRNTSGHQCTLDPWFKNG